MGALWEQGAPNSGQAPEVATALGSHSTANPINFSCTLITFTKSELSRAASQIYGHSNRITNRRLTTLDAGAAHSVVPIIDRLIGLPNGKR